MKDGCGHPERHASEHAERPFRQPARQEVGLLDPDQSAALVAGHGPQLGGPRGVNFNGDHLGPTGGEGSAQGTGPRADVYDQFSRGDTRPMD
jgi:hypothetical protein